MTSKLTLREQKVLHLLKLKKFRQKYGQFVVEGEKMVRELLHSPLHLIYIIATKEFSDLEWLKESGVEVKEVELQEYKKFSSMVTPPQIAALVQLPNNALPSHFNLQETSLFLDQIKDPGNLGTIIRIADWYGIQQIFCSPECVDAYNPKTLSSTMGSIGRVTITYVDSSSLFKHTSLPKIAMVLGGESLQKTTLPSKALILIGSESHGLSDAVIEQAEFKVTIQRHGAAESLNAAVATAIICEKIINGTN